MRVVNVQSLLPISFLDYVPENFNVQVRRGLEKEIAAVAAKIDCAPERVSTTLLFGPVYQKVLAEAEDWGADLIVLCSHRPGMDRFLIGSNATTIVNHAQCSVLVVRGCAPKASKTSAALFGFAIGDRGDARACEPKVAPRVTRPSRNSHHALT